MQGKNSESVLRENNELKQQLRQANAVILSLRQEVEALRRQLALVQPPSTPPRQMQMEEHFESSPTSSDSDSPTISPPQRSPAPLTYSSNIGNRPTPWQSKSKKVIFNSEEDYPRKSIQKVLKRSTERKKHEEEENNQSIDESCRSEADSRSPGESNRSTVDGYKSVSSRDISSPHVLFPREYASVRSQKTILFRKTSNSRPIFDFFFITGYSHKGPLITYAYPPSNHNFQAYLSLLYGDSPIRAPDISPSNSRNKLPPPNPVPLIRDTFVIPIIKPEARNSDKDYLIVCEVEEPVLERQLAGCQFSRFYCFISQWKFFAEFKRLIGQLVDRIHAGCREREGQAGFAQLAKEQVEQGVAFLHQKTTDYNKTLDCCIGNSGLRFSADIPPAEMGYQLIEKYQPWSVVNLMVQLRSCEEEPPSAETRLLGVMVAYALAEVKMVLYSATKSKISEALLQLLEVIKPLTYVNPIILAALREEHQDFLGAPMSLILGLWAEQRKPNRQKIEIFMNKKHNLSALIEKAKLELPDGIVINLDTGLVFGGGIQPSLTSLAQRLNLHRQRTCKYPRDIYKLMQRLLAGRGELEESKEVGKELLACIGTTQSYCYYMENAHVDMNILGRKEASQLAGVFAEGSQPGSGLLVGRETVEEGGEYIAGIVMDMEGIKKGKNELMTNDVSICLKVDSKYTATHHAFVTYFNDEIRPLMEKIKVCSLLLLADENTDRHELLLIQREIQARNLVAIVECSIIATNWHDYQLKLLSISSDLLEQPNLLISAISLLLRLPQIPEKEPQHYTKKLLSIWRRCIPSKLGSIIIQDWLQTSNPNIIFNMHFLKDLPICWTLQFSTLNPKNLQPLGCQCLGID